jgi:chromosome segregation ATPase
VFDAEACAELQDQYEQLDSAFKDELEAGGTLIFELNELEQRAGVAADLLDRQERELAELEFKRSEAEIELADAEGELDEVLNESLEYEAKQASLQQTLDQLRIILQRIDSLEEEATALADQLDGDDSLTDAQRAALQALYVRILEDLDALQMEQQQLGDPVQLAEELLDVAVRLAEKRAKAAEYEEKIEDLIPKIEEMHGPIDALSGSIGETEVRLQGLESAAEAKQKQLDQQTDKLKDMHKETYAVWDKLVTHCG